MMLINNIFNKLKSGLPQRSTNFLKIFIETLLIENQKISLYNYYLI